MSHALSPISSEFEAVEQEAECTAWLQAKVAASLADGKPIIAAVEHRMETPL